MSNKEINMLQQLVDESEILLSAEDLAYIAKYIRTKSNNRIYVDLISKGFTMTVN